MIIYLVGRGKFNEPVQSELEMERVRSTARLTPWLLHDARNGSKRCTISVLEEYFISLTHTDTLGLGNKREERFIMVTNM